MPDAEELIDTYLAELRINDATGGVSRMGTSDWEFERKLNARRRRPKPKGHPERENFGLAGLPGGTMNPRGPSIQQYVGDPDIEV